MERRETSSVERNVEVLSEKFKGEVVVSVKEELLEKASQECQWVLALQLLNKGSFNIQGFSQAMKRAWGLNAGVQIWEIPNAIAIARFDDERKMMRVLDGGPWRFNKTTVVMQRWSLDSDIENMDLRKLRVWVQLHRIPWMLMTEEIAKNFAEVAGSVCKAAATEAEGVKRKFIRFLVEVDVETPLRRGCYMNRPGKEPLWIAFKYERLQELCDKCGALRHDRTGCLETGMMEDCGRWLRAETDEVWVPGRETSGNSRTDFQNVGTYGSCGEDAGCRHRDEERTGDVGTHGLQGGSAIEGAIAAATDETERQYARIDEGEKVVRAVEVDAQGKLSGGVATKLDKGKKVIGPGRMDEMVVDEEDNMGAI